MIYQIRDIDETAEPFKVIEFKLIDQGVAVSIWDINEGIDDSHYAFTGVTLEELERVVKLLKSERDGE